MAYDHEITDADIQTPDKHGYDTENPDFSGTNDHDNLEPPYSTIEKDGLTEIMFQEVDVDNGASGRMFKCVRTVESGDYSDLEGRVFDEITTLYLSEEIEHGKHEYEAQIVWLNGKLEDYKQENRDIGSDDINRDKLDDWKHEPGDLL